MDAASSGRSPIPLSATSMITSSACALTAIVTVEPVGEYLPAFSMTWPSACSTRPESSLSSGSASSMSTASLCPSSRWDRCRIAAVTRSAGSAHSSTGLIPESVMRTVSSRFWMSLSRRFASRCMPSTSERMRPSSRNAGMPSSTLVEPRIEAIGERSWCETLPMSALLRKSDCSRWFALAKAAAASIRSSAVAASDRITSRRSFNSPVSRDDGIVDRGLVGLLLRLDQERLAAEMARQIVLDRRDEIGVRRAQGEPARQQMEIVDVALAPPQPVGLAPQRGGEIAGHQSHEEEHGEVDNLARLSDRKAVERGEKEEIEHCDARKRRDHGRADAPADRRDDHRNQVERRVKLERRVSRRDRQNERCRADQQQREHEISQGCADERSAPAKAGFGTGRTFGRRRSGIYRSDTPYMRHLPQSAELKPDETRTGARTETATRRQADPSRRPPH